jgi:hypothetical protein
MTFKAILLNTVAFVGFVMAATSVGHAWHAPTKTAPTPWWLPWLASMVVSGKTWSAFLEKSGERDLEEPDLGIDAETAWRRRIDAIAVHQTCLICKNKLNSEKKPKRGRSRRH